MGKGRRERVLPLWKETQFALRAWLAIRPNAQAAEIFLNANGQPMTRDGFAFRLAEHVKTAATKQPSILGKRVTPHFSRDVSAGGHSFDFVVPATRDRHSGTTSRPRAGLALEDVQRIMRRGILL
jgi:site-specific recombinase XerC